MGGFGTLAALFSQARFAKLVVAYGPRYMACVTAALAIFATAAAALVASSALEDNTIARLQAEGQVSRGQVVDLEIESNRRRPEHQVWVTYRFADRSGKSHTATDYRRFYGPPRLVTAQPIDVLYDMADPDRSRMAVGLADRRKDLKTTMLSGLLGVILFGAYVVRFFQWRRFASPADRSAVHG